MRFSGCVFFLQPLVPQCCSGQQKSGRAAAADSLDRHSSADFHYLISSGERRAPTKTDYIKFIIKTGAYKLKHVFSFVV